MFLMQECEERMMDWWKVPVTPFIAYYETKAAYTTKKHPRRISDLDSLHGSYHQMPFSKCFCYTALNQIQH